MAIIYLKHPKYGTKVATMDLEAECDEQNGWVRYTHNTPLISEKIIESEVETQAAPVNTLEVKRRRKTI